MSVITNRRARQVADEFAAIAVAQPSSSTPVAGTGRFFAESATPRSFSDRAERGVELFSRWAGIISFAAAIGAIGWLIF